jgi:hypothetical protein
MELNPKVLKFNFKILKCVQIIFFFNQSSLFLMTLELILMVQFTKIDVIKASGQTNIFSTIASVPLITQLYFKIQIFKQNS